MQKSATKTEGTALRRTLGRTKNRPKPAPAKKTAMAQASSDPANMTEIAAPKSSKRLAEGRGVVAVLIVVRNQPNLQFATIDGRTAIQPDKAGKVSPTNSKISQT
jgi:hypothetical protein